MAEQIAHVLDRESAIQYWDRRHGEQSALRAGGDVGLDQIGNQAFYMQRLGLLLATLGGPGSAVAPPRLLDVGCGNGWFARELTSCGYAVTGVDSSLTAISAARSAGGGPRYVHASLDDFWLADVFDAVVSVDVLFHITDDTVFESAVNRINAHVAIGGLLVIADRNDSDRAVLGDYIVHRPQAEYAELLVGYSPLGFRPYEFPSNPIGFHAYRKDLA